MNSMVKYICVEELEQDIDKFKHAEKLETEIFHSTYDELHDSVFRGCPPGYKCTEPIALFHEVLWSTGLRLNGGKCVRDELHHALERWEYDILKAGDGKMLCLCVDIIRTSSGPRSQARLEVL